MLRTVLKTLALAMPLAALPLGAGAHPHVFVDTTLRIVTDDTGRAVGVEVRWRYDDLYSLLIFEDMQLDADYDGALTPAELAKLAGFDMQWVEGFEGDLYAVGPDGPIALSPPEPVTTEVREARIETVHIRRFAQPLTGPFDLRAYDPTFYTAYDLTGGVHAPDGCSVTVERADIKAAQARVEQELKTFTGGDDDYPAVGDAFADRVQVACIPRS